MRVCYALLLVFGAAACVRTAVDQLFRARCAAACLQHTKNSKTQCESECVLRTRSKPGRCPPLMNLTWYQTACLTSCSHDTDCPDTDKCCAHDCGVTCQQAVDLETDTGLPEVPHNLTVTDTHKQRSKLVQWSDAEPADQVFYVMQIRRSAIHRQNFEPWKTRLRRRKNSMTLADLTPAHWYQVRVAAVNANGSRGYSTPSVPFKLKIGPSRPEEPQNLTVSRPGWVEGRLWVELRWKRPKSDLPLKYYRVFWSHCVMTEESPSKACKPQSVIVKRKLLNYTRTNYILKDLQPHALYFVQVQAIAIVYESKKLSSEKAVTFIDTSEHKNATYDWRLQPKHSIKKLKILSYYRSNADKLEAHLSWESSPGRFMISWSPQGSCASAMNNPTYEAMTEDTEYMLDHLAFNCKYQVTVRAQSSQKTAKIPFTTPLCAQIPSKEPC